MVELYSKQTGRFGESNGHTQDIKLWMLQIILIILPNGL